MHSGTNKSWWTFSKMFPIEKKELSNPCYVHGHIAMQHLIIATVAKPPGSTITIAISSSSVVIPVVAMHKISMRPSAYKVKGGRYSPQHQAIQHTVPHIPECHA